MSSEYPNTWPTIVGPGSDVSLENYHSMVRMLQHEYGLLGNPETDVVYAQQMEAGLYAGKLLALAGETLPEAERTATYDSLLQYYSVGLAGQEADPVPPEDVRLRFDDMLVTRLGNQEARDDLAEVRQQGEQARTAMVLGALGLAASVVYRFTSVTLDKMRQADAISEANIGLLHAIGSYDYRRGSFSTYAYNGIQRHLSRNLPDHDNVIHVPHNIFHAAGASIEQAYGQAAANMSEADIYSRAAEIYQEKLASRRGGPIEFNDLLQVLGSRVQSLDNHIDMRGTTLGEQLAETKAADENNSEGAASVEAGTDTAFVQDILDERQLRLVHLRYGTDMTLAQIGQEMGVSRQAVDQALKVITNKVRHAYEAPASEEA